MKINGRICYVLLFLVFSANAASNQYWVGGFCSKDNPGDISVANNWDNNTHSSG